VVVAAEVHLDQAGHRERADPREGGGVQLVLDRVLAPLGEDLDLLDAGGGRGLVAALDRHGAAEAGRIDDLHLVGGGVALDFQDAAGQGGDGAGQEGALLEGLEPREEFAAALVGPAGEQTVHGNSLGRISRWGPAAPTAAGLLFRATLSPLLRVTL